ncbi:MAG: GAF domain-containing sensor histidine kinase [Chloroflexi bacterium AL-W]|nr:GAF domain-containing sensor histidine kinase [Chloroflexi bacterium AL-N1]NOK69640.1 GAF domain-containing sensor histidine kinase [Chloroflexi bacterium AL-N10]NOK72187.1 GAF domain-containing sensor histidine kinase [Chloroflexi bacterium AL-N5]NOK85016.1 GAF domain-containing sensor histidine kinase [Chloroflexi bacterium AL-W]NOK91769.1 GAF domain-containing sensor histidine kinase [Chloroflexi bacterium AL-N15]
MTDKKDVTKVATESSVPHRSRWQLLLQLRWYLSGVVILAFASGQLLEALILGDPRTPTRFTLDIIGWGFLGGLAVWLSLTWTAHQERRHQTGIQQALREQRDLNQQLQRANEYLALLSNVNRHIAGSTSLDNILDSALTFPQQLVPARAAALFLRHATGPIATRIRGVKAEELQRLRQAAGLTTTNIPGHPHLYTMPDHSGSITACLIVPLHDGLDLIGWIELYLDRVHVLPDDEMNLLETIASEIAEAVVSTRRRSREERAIYELERAIAEERARIARDIHDGMAQTMAFRRMRIDLWLDWIETEPEQLRKELTELKGTLREQIADLRRAIFALRPIQFDELGFVGGLRRYAVEFARQQEWEFHVDFDTTPSTLPHHIEATCFRIIQEALTNIAKHTRATRVDVMVTVIDHGLQITVRDNGNGFDPKHTLQDNPDSVGLRQMHERLTALRGLLTILSHPGSGTEVRAWLPLEPMTEKENTNENTATTGRRSPNFPPGVTRID